MKTGVLMNETDSTLQEPARKGTGWRIFFAAWTLFVVSVAWWLWHRAGRPISSASWSVRDLGAGAPALDRLANWFKLADLNFHRVYPWILLAPYVAWVAWRFPWGRRQWRASLPAHVAGCALLAISTHLVWAYADTYADGRHPVEVMVYMRPGARSGRAQGANRDSGQLGGSVAVPVPAWVTNRLAKQPAGVPFRFGGPDGGKDQMTGGRTTRLEPHTYGGVAARGRLVRSPFDLLSLFVYAGLVGLVQTVQLQRRSKERERRAEALEAQLTAARLSALQAQLNPHFLFNALNAISTLLVRDARAARDALASFSELLRLALRQSTQAEVTLGEDLEFLRRYVEIQQTRLGDRLRFEEVIAPETLGCLVPALLLQPLVENAIRHGIETSLRPGLVRVVGQPQAKRLKLIVEDNGTGLSGGRKGDGDGVGIGLKNLKARLETLYGPEHRLEFEPSPEGGVVVSVEIPLRRGAGGVHPTPLSATSPSICAEKVRTDPAVLGAPRIYSQADPTAQ